MSYHKNEITPGVYGEASKIREEFQEFWDAWEQGSIVMQLVELSDMLGAIEEYLKPLGIPLSQLIQFSDITKSAFKDGTRKPKENKE